MTWSSPVIKIKAARRKHQCDWCSEDIMPTMPYHKWVFKKEGLLQTCKVHPECDEAILDYQDVCAGEEWLQHHNNRGCSCFKDPDCDNCYG